MSHKLNRLIIENRTSLSDQAALEKVIAVIKMGKISESRNKIQYCFHTCFADDTEVWCAKNKGSDRFVVTYSK